MDDECEVIASESAMPVALAAPNQKIGGADKPSSSSGGQPPPDVALFPLHPDDEPPEPEREEIAEVAEVHEEKEPKSKKSKETHISHRPKNPFCETCVRAKMQAPQAQRRHGSSPIEAKSLGDHVTTDHETYGLKGEWNALVIPDVFAQFPGC